MYYVVFAIFCFGFFVIYRTIHSPFGQILKAIRENEPRAISLGYDVAKFKLIAFIISASLAGMAGATKTLVFQLASLSDVHWHASGEVVLMTLLGGSVPSSARSWVLPPLSPCRLSCRIRSDPG
jgi:branched-chain amino acid transport system permease protein